MNTNHPAAAHVTIGHTTYIVFLDLGREGQSRRLIMVEIGSPDPTMYTFTFHRNGHWEFHQRQSEDLVELEMDPSDHTEILAECLGKVRFTLSHLTGFQGVPFKDGNFPSVLRVVHSSEDFSAEISARSDGFRVTMADRSGKTLLQCIVSGETFYFSSALMTTTLRFMWPGFWGPFVVCSPLPIDTEQSEHS